MSHFYRSSLLNVALLTLATALLPVIPAWSQAGGGSPNSSDEVESNPQFWQASFLNGGHYLVKLGAVLTASKHEYVSDGVARVVEVNIGTGSAMVARFYFLEPVLKNTPLAAGQTIMNRAEDVTRQVAARAAPGGAQLQVIKNYPASTHAHTSEYVLQTETALNALYTSIIAAINTGRGRTWKETAGK
jgi:hypothetical protein